MFDTEHEGIPAGMDEMSPGPALAAFLSTIDVDRVSGYDRVVVLRAAQRMASHFQAQVYAAMAAVAESMEEIDFGEPDLAWEAAATEIRAALRLTRRAAEWELCTALEVRQRLPRVWSALAQGDIDPRRARTIANGTAHLEQETARGVVEEVIEEAPRLTTGELGARVRRLGMEVDPEGAKERYQKTLSERRVVTEASPDGTAHLLGLDLAPDRVAEVSRRIDRLAKSLRRAGDSRTADQLRADVFLDLLSGLHPDSRGGMVELQVDLETLAELSEAPGELGGMGPVIADIARQVARAQTQGEWRFSITHPETGLSIQTGTTRRRPSASQRREVEARDRTCVFPGCRMPATSCDLDHRIPWSELRRTSVSGLVPGCRYDHLTVRHKLGWVYRPLPGGDYLWISPLGHRYTKSGRPP